MRLILTTIFCLILCACSAQSLYLTASGSIALTQYYNDTRAIDDSNSIALFHFDNSLTTDISGNDWALSQTSGSTPTLAANTYKFGASSLEDNTSFDASGWSLTASDTTDFQFGAGDFTIEFWFQLQGAFFGTTAIQHPLYAFELDDYLMRVDYYLDVTTDKLNIVCAYASDTLTLGGSPPEITQGQWYHCCFERYNNTLAFFLDGVKYNETTGELGTATLTPSIVTLSRASTSNLNALFNIDELRISNIARYENANFTPETRPFGVPINPSIAFKYADLEPVAGMVAWYDAADLSTITTSGTSVLQWDDKSGNGYNATQATAIDQPKSGLVTRNGRNVITFDNDDLECPGLITPILDSSYTIFCVFNKTNMAAVSEKYIYYFGAVSSNKAVFLNSINLDLRHGWYGYDLDTGGNIASSTTAYYNVTCTYDSAASLRETYLGYDIVASDTPADHNGNNERALIGKGPSSSFPGNMAEIIVYHSALSDEEIAQNIAYLNRKWGI